MGIKHLARIISLLVIAAVFAFSACHTTSAFKKESGLASFYGKPFHNKQTASGELFDMHAMTAAHRTLPFNTKVRVTRIDTGKSVIVRINDRGPFKKSRIIDLSYAAAKNLGFLSNGTAEVTVEVLH